MARYNICRQVICCVVLTAVLLRAPVIAAWADEGCGNNEKRACWISFLDIEVYLKDLNEQDFCAEVSKMYDKVIANHMNTVIVHVRAMGDAVYPSEYYPWSVYISENRKNPGYDPLKIMTQLAKERGLYFEAWVNPYRLSKDEETTAAFRVTEYYERYKPFIIEYRNGTGETCLSLDPARQETMELISNGVRELVENYDIDAVHFDDYFYMPGMADGLSGEDKKAYVNMLVAKVYATVKAANPNCLFGISPAGNIQNAREQGADVDTWLSEEGYVDYIMPQLYWTDSYRTDEGMACMFSDRCLEWQTLNVRDIPIYTGLALYRVGEESDNDLGWSLSDTNLAEQYETAYNMGYDGYALFRYAWLDEPSAAPELENLRQYAEGLPEPRQPSVGEGEISGQDSSYGTLYEPYNYEENSFVSYTLRMSEGGWTKAGTEGYPSGNTEGTAAVYALRMSLGIRAGEGEIAYRVYTAGAGWQAWAADGEICGTKGYTEPVTALQIKLGGHVAENYDVNYRVYCADKGWLDWRANGATAGTAFYDSEIRAVQIFLTPKADRWECRSYILQMW